MLAQRNLKFKKKMLLGKKTLDLNLLPSISF